MSARSIPKRENEVTAESVCADLPEGWAISSVGDCFHDVRNGTTATQKKVGVGIPVSRIETIQNRRFDMTRVQHLEDANDDFVENFRYRHGDIAFSHINSFEHVGKTALYEGEPEVFIHGMNLLRLRLGHSFVEPKFAHLFMQTKKIFESIANTVFLASVRFCELHDLLCVHCSRPTSDLASRLEQYHGWDTGDSELRCCQRGYFRIQLRENDLG